MKRVSMLDLESFGGAKGSLVALEQHAQAMPFELKRVYYIYGVPTGARRGFHAHKHLHQLILCPSGSCKIEIRTQSDSKVFVLDRPDKALLIEEPVWREMYDFSPGCALIIFASDYYDPEDYIWDFDEFVAFRKQEGV